jgi:hypothetical protein
MVVSLLIRLVFVSVGPWTPGRDEDSGWGFPVCPASYRCGCFRVFLVAMVGLVVVLGWVLVVV